MKHLNLTPELYDYMLDISLREDPVLRELREETAKISMAAMQVAPEQAQFMQFLLRLIDARKVLELGTFTGYSALAMALALPEDGLLITCDIQEEWTSKAQIFWKKAKQDKKIQLRLLPALDSLQNLLSEGQTNSFDFIFIDADKRNYLRYYEFGLQLLKPQGILAIDNVLWGGDVIDQHKVDAQTREIRQLNERIKEDNSIEMSLLAIADGLSLIRKKPQT